MSQNIRNIAVIAHVDHGKTTLVDALLKQTHVFRQNQQEMSEERIMDSNILEKERGITIMAKNCSVTYKGVKINIIDTPGHADFSGEVERTLGMADGALLIIDAQEGPMPQTRFVLKKALELDLKIIVIINKIDKALARPTEALQKTESLFLELATTEKQLEFPHLYAIGRKGVVFPNLPQNINQKGDITPLLDTIIDQIPSPNNNTNAPFKMIITSLGYDNHLGRLAIGKIHRGTIHLKDKVTISQNPEQIFQIEKITAYSGLDQVVLKQSSAGEIVTLAGVSSAKIGQTLTDPAHPEPLPEISVTEPTIHMTLGPNTSPFAGREGEFSTSRQIEDRLNKELETNLSLRVEKLESSKFKISGRGELHLSILLENLRREGYEMEVGKPEVITKQIDGQKMEPIEELNIIVPEKHSGTINQELGKRYAILISTNPTTQNETELVFHIPTRSTIGLRNLLLTTTKGTVIFNSQFLEYQPIGRSVPKLRRGALISATSGEALTYGLQNAQGRGETFISPATQVYEGMIVGQNAKNEDIEINVCKGKKLTNMRAASADDITQLTPHIALSLEQSLDFLESDELLEITPTSLRLRKKILSALDRKRNFRQQRHSQTTI